MKHLKRTILLTLIAVIGLNLTAQADSKSICNFYKSKTSEYTKLIESNASEDKRNYDKKTLESYQLRYTTNCTTPSKIATIR